MQKKTDTPKIDPRLIEEELKWRGKTVQVSDNGESYQEGIFHTAIGSICFCINEDSEDDLISWNYARISPDQWRSPTKRDADDLCTVQCRQDVSDEWAGGYELIAMDSASSQYVVRLRRFLDDGSFDGYEFQIVEHCRILDKELSASVAPRKATKPRKRKTK